MSSAGVKGEFFCEKVFSIREKARNDEGYEWWGSLKSAVNKDIKRKNRA